VAQSQVNQATRILFVHKQTTWFSLKVSIP